MCYDLGRSATNRVVNSRLLNTRSVGQMIGKGLKIIGAVTLLYIGATLLQIWYSATRDEAQPVDAIVVLGAAQWAGRPSPVLRARLNHAIQLYEQGHAPLLITTGGYGRDPNFSEGGVGAAYAEIQGVPREALLSEEAGGTTWESMLGVAELARANGVQRILVVSDPFHIARAKAMAGALGLEAYGSPTRTSPISRRFGVETIYVLRELVSLTVYRLEWLLSETVVAELWSRTVDDGVRNEWQIAAHREG